MKFEDPMFAFLKKRGGLVEIEGSIEPTRVQMAQILNEFEGPVEIINSDYTKIGCRGVNLALGFFQSYKFNAICATRGGQDYIAISAGVFLRLRWFFAQAIHHKLLNGHPSFPIEESSPIKGDSIEKFAGDDEITSRGRFFDLAERDQLMVLRLVSISMSYILHHELAHLWEGHCELANRNGIEEIDELLVSQENDIGQIDLYSQAMEIDADRLALNGVLFEQLGVAFIGETIAWIPGSDLRGLPCETALYEIVFCAYTTFRFLHHMAGGEGLNVKPSNTHPPTFSRIWWFIERFRHILRNGANFPEQIVDDIIFTAVRQAEDLFVVIMRCGQLDLLSEDQIAVSRAININLDLVWQKFFRDLEFYKRGQNIPDTQLALSGFDKFISLPDLVENTQKLAISAKVIYEGKWKADPIAHIYSKNNVIARITSRHPEADLGKWRSAINGRARARLQYLKSRIAKCQEALMEADSHREAASAFYRLSKYAVQVKRWFEGLTPGGGAYNVLKILQMDSEPHLNYIFELPSISEENAVNYAVREMSYSAPGPSIPELGHTLDIIHILKMSRVFPFIVGERQIRPPLSWWDENNVQMASPQCVGEIFFAWFAACCRDADLA